MTNPAAVGGGLAASVPAPQLLPVIAAGILLLAASTLAWRAVRRSPPTTPGPQPARLSGAQQIVLALLLVLATALRLWGANSDLWYDEVITLVEFVRLPAWELVTTYTTPNNHILFSLAAHFSVEIFGEAAWSLRLPAIFFGTASVWAVVYLVRLIASADEALWAGLLMALSYQHVWFSQNARGYTGLLFWAILGTAVFYQALRQTGPRLWLWYAAILGLALYTHLTAVFVFMAHGVVYLFLLGHRRWRPVPADPVPGSATLWPLMGFALGLLLALQAYSLILWQMIQAFGEQAGAVAAQVKVSEWRNPVWTVVETVRGLSLGLTSIAGVAAAGLLAMIGAAKLWRNHRVLLWLMWLNVPITLAVLLAVKFHVWPRYFFVNLGFGLVLIIVGTWSLGRRLDAALRFRRSVTGPLAAALMALLAATTLPANYRLPKQAYSAARDYVEQRRAERDPVVTAGLAARPYAELYAPGWDSVTSVAQLVGLEDSAARPWVVYSFPTYMETAHPELLEHLASSYDSVAAFPGSLSGGTVLVYHKAPGH